MGSEGDQILAISSSFYSPSVLSLSTGTTASQPTAVTLLKYANGETGSEVSAIQQLQNTLNNMDALASRQRIMAGAIDRIRGVATGQITPTADWEMTGGFLASTGVPFKLEVSDVGKVTITPQSDLISTMPTSQQAKFNEVLSRLDEVRGLYEEETTKSDLRDKLHFAILRVTQLDNYAPTREPWEDEFQTRRTMGRPMMIGLTPEGNLDVFDQAETNFAYVEDDKKRTKLQQAMMKLEAIIGDLNKTRKLADNSSVTSTSTANDNSTTVTTSTNSEGVYTHKEVNVTKAADDNYLNTTTATTTTSVYPSGVTVPNTTEDSDSSDGSTTSISVDEVTGATTIVTWKSQITKVEDIPEAEEDTSNGIVTDKVVTSSQTTDADNYMTTLASTVSTTTVPAGVDLPDIPADSSNTTSTVSVDSETGITTITTTTSSSTKVKVYDDVVAANELWQYSALGRRSAGDDYFLDIDDKGEIQIRNNKSVIKNTSILPSYLQTNTESEFYIVPEYLRGAGKFDFYDSSWEKNAMDLYSKKLPFYIDTSGSLPRAKELDYSAIMIADILSSSRSNQLLQARLSLLI